MVEDRSQPPVRGVTLTGPCDGIARDSPVKPDPTGIERGCRRARPTGPGENGSGPSRESAGRGEMISALRVLRDAPLGTVCIIHRVCRARACSSNSAACYRRY